MSSAEQKVYYTEEDYYNLPKDVSAEIINGEIYYKASPNFSHQEISSELHITIGNHLREKGSSCKLLAAPFDVKLSDNPTTIVQPDLMVVCDKDKLENDKRYNGAPDWVIEIISPSTSSHDYVKKLNLYFDSGVREYWIIDHRIEKVTVYNFRNLELYAETYTFQDKIKVNIFDEFEIDFKEISERLGW